MNADFKPRLQIYKSITTQAYPKKMDYIGFPLKSILDDPACRRWQIKSKDGFITIIDNKLIEGCEQKGACPIILFDKEGRWPNVSQYGGILALNL